MPDVSGVTNYPAGLDNHFTLMPVRDVESTTLDAPGVNSSAVSFPVIDTTGWPAAGYFTIQGEHVSYTSKTLTSYNGCSRGLFQSLGGAAPAAHATASPIELLAISANHEVHSDALINLETKVGTGADTPTAGDFLKGTGPGTSGWSPLTSGEISTALGFAPGQGVILQESDVTKVGVMLTLDVDGNYLSAADEGSGEGRVSWASPPVLATGILSIAAGVVTLPAAKGPVSRIAATIDTESAAASDDLDTLAITGSVPAGTELILQSLAGGRITTVKHDPAKIALDSGQDFLLATTTHRLTLVRSGTLWVEKTRQPANLRIGSVVQAWDPDLDALAATPTNYLRLPGEIVQYGGAAAPTGWLLCDGASYLRATYPALFSIIGTTFGAADGTHFSVPDLRDRFPIGKGVAVASDALGETGGVTAVTLTAAESGLQSHTHAASAGGEDTAHVHGFTDNAMHTVGLTGFQSGGQGHDRAVYDGTYDYTDGETAGHSHAITVSAVGAAAASAAHTNMPPFLAVNYLIKV